MGELRRRGWRIVVFLVVVAGGVDAVGQETAVSSSPSTTRKPMCALIADRAMGLAGSPLVAMVEVKLSGDRRITLLERGEIDKLIAERELQELFGAEAGSKRSALGALLKAELLVLLRAGEQKGEGRWLDVVICETRSGLRLRVERSAWADDAQTEAEADRVAALVEQALLKYQAPVRHILAVPPFAGSDFLHKYDYLQNLYARTIEQLLIAEPGIIVVELAEARAIADELALAGQRQSVERNLPYYLLGEYRIDPKDGQDQARISLLLNHGERKIDERQREGLAVDDVIAFLHQATRELLKQVTGAAPTGKDVGTEVKQLVAWAEVFKRSRDWTQALSLIEAAALLQPDNAELHAEAIHLAVQLMNSVARPTGGEAELDRGDPTEKYLPRATLALHSCKVGIDHTERWLRCTVLQPQTDTSIVSKVSEGFWQWKKVEARVSEEQKVQERLRELQKSYRQMLLSLLEERVASGQITKQNLAGFASGIEVHIQKDAKEFATRYIDIVRRVPGVELEIIALVLEKVDHFSHRDGRPIKMDKDLALELIRPETARRIEGICGLAGPGAEGACKAMRQLAEQALSFLIRAEADEIESTVQRMEDSRGDSFVFSVDSARRAICLSRVARGKLSDAIQKRKPAEENVPSEVTFEPIGLRADEDGARRTLGLWQPLLGWKPCGDQVDVLWTSDEVFIMKKKGIVKQLQTFKGTSFGNWFGQEVADPQIDSRYVWVVEEKPEPTIVVVDTATEKTYRFTSSNGLPPVGGWLQAAPFATGKACIAAAFGKPGSGPADFDRSWIGVAELVGAGQIRVDIVLEADFRVEKIGAQVPSGRNAVFQPEQIVAVPGGEGGPGPKAIVFASVFYGDPGQPQYVVDPQHRTAIQVAQEHGRPVFPRFDVCHTFTEGGWLCVLDGPSLVRVNAANVVPETYDVLPGGRGGRSVNAPQFHHRDTCSNSVVGHDGLVYALSDRLWVGKCCGAPLKPVPGKPGLDDPRWRFRRLGWSNHYGLVMLTGNQDTETSAAYRIAVSQTFLDAVREDNSASQPAPAMPDRPGVPFLRPQGMPMPRGGPRSRPAFRGPDR